MNAIWIVAGILGFYALIVLLVEVVVRQDNFDGCQGNRTKDRR